ncbi:Fic family protein [Subtercola lobariae]|uniref:Fic family protein n=1 Tax=Subtercola lobariae TaxID=1588641 RepID=A0A917B122_9MICO|nr:Fic family protein [Subtercola lobariae]GGF10767.1 Fic family protein [Subtercola lobariae]
MAVARNTEARAINSTGLPQPDDTWPPHEREVLTWSSRSYHQGSPPREDRDFSSYSASIPPRIARLEFRPSTETAALLERAAADVSSLDAGAGTYLSGLGGFLIRTESVASSKIESIDAAPDEFLRSMAGSVASRSADETVAAITALTAFVDAVGEAGRINLDDMLHAHRALMADDLTESSYAGRIRDVQNWIGGSDYTPRDAIHVPPAPSRLPGLMDDLLAFCARDDISAIAQAAIAHAQFESIHPFTDGNGRIGRALISAVLRRRGLTTTTVPPIASAMLADTTRYFSLVNDYREGAADEFVAYLARSASLASTEAVKSAAALAALPAQWKALAEPRSGSADEHIIESLLAVPVLTSARASTLSSASTSTTFLALDRLTRSSVLRELTGKRRDRVWVAQEVMDELDRLNERIGRRVRAS